MPSAKPKNNSSYRPTTTLSTYDDVSRQTTDDRQANGAKSRRSISPTNREEKRPKSSRPENNGTENVHSALHSINTIYKKLTEKHEEEIEKLEKESAQLRIENKVLHNKNSKLEKRSDELERENIVNVTRIADLVKVTNDMRDRKEEAENEIRAAGKKHSDLMTSFTELKRQSEHTAKELDKAKEKIRRMHRVAGSKTNRAEERMERRIRDDERLLSVKDEEIAKLKKELDEVRKVSINIRDSLRLK